MIPGMYEAYPSIVSIMIRMMVVGSELSISMINLHISHASCLHDFDLLYASV